MRLFGLLRSSYCVVILVQGLECLYSRGVLDVFGLPIEVTISGRFSCPLLTMVLYFHEYLRLNSRGPNQRPKKTDCLNVKLF
jgi:hypothetical protein